MSIEIVHNKHNDYCREYYQKHKLVCSNRHKINYKQKKDKILVRNKLYRSKHKNEISANKREYYQINLVAIKNYRKLNKDYYDAKTEEYRISGKLKMTQKNYHLKHPGVAEAYKLRIKTEVLTHYGNGKCACIKCGYDDIRALSIDHINGDGYKDRKKTVGVFCYNWLITNKYPDGYQTLCMNCQFIKRNEHKEHRWRIKKDNSCAN